MREAGHPTNRQGFDRGRGLADRIFPSFAQAFNSRKKWDILRSPLSLCRRAGLSSSSLTPGVCKRLHSRLGCDGHIRLCGVPATAGIATRQNSISAPLMLANSAWRATYTLIWKWMPKCMSCRKRMKFSIPVVSICFQVQFLILLG